MVLRQPFLPILPILFLILSLRYVRATLHNFTLDDQNGDPSGRSHVEYLPSNDSWIRGDTCTQCAGVLNTSQVFDGTWHNASTTGSSFPSINLTFTGTAGYVFCIVQRSTFWTNLTIDLDGVQSGTYSNDLFAATDPAYNQVVYSVQGLDDIEHTIIINMDNPKNTDFDYNLLLFDRFIFTADNSTSVSSSATRTASSATGTKTLSSSSTTSSSSGSNSGSDSGISTGAAVAIAIGAIVFVCLLIGGLVYWWRKKRRGSAESASWTNAGGGGGDAVGSMYTSVPNQGTSAFRSGGSSMVPLQPSGSLGTPVMQSMDGHAAASSVNMTITSNYASSLNPAQYDPIPAMREPIRYTGLPEA